MVFKNLAKDGVHGEKQEPAADMRDRGVEPEQRDLPEEYPPHDAAEIISRCDDGTSVLLRFRPALDIEALRRRQESLQNRRVCQLRASIFAQLPHLTM